MVEVVRNAEGMWVVMKREVEVRMEEVAREEEAMLAVGGGGAEDKGGGEKGEDGGGGLDGE
eukprot:scaffold283670_cov32-Tisochrysis_lutea.AAC.1